MADVEEHLVSCIIATHNDGKYLNESISSILGQTHKNVECIVVDDGSTDGTSTLVGHWYSDPRFSYMHQAQGGVSLARNLGVQRSTGDFLAFLDADDRWNQDKIRIQLEFLLDNSQFDFCWSDQELMDGSGKPLGNRVYLDPQYPLTSYILTSGWYAPPSTWLLKRSLFDTSGGFDERLPSGHEDVEMVFRFACHGLGARCAAAFVWRRVRRDSISRDVRLKGIRAVQVFEQMLSYDNGRYRHLRRDAMHSLHCILAGHCWENDAYGEAAIEAVKAAWWNPRFVFSRNFRNTVVLSQINRLFRKSATHANTTRSS